MPTCPRLLQSARPARSAAADVILTCCVTAGCADSVAALMTSVTPACNAVLVRLSATGYINIDVPSLNFNFIALILVESMEIRGLRLHLHFGFERGLISARTRDGCL